MTALTLRDVTFPLDGFEVLEREASTAGHAFLTRLHSEWQGNTNRFNAPGEYLLGAHVDDVLVALGGLNRDPHIDGIGIGRLRHIYVRQDRRRQGIATRLVRTLLARNTHFQIIRLRTPNPAASAFYERLGFKPIVNATATHTITTP